MHPLVNLAKQAVESYVQYRTVVIPLPEELTEEMRERAGVFVSLKIEGKLRGCIGTFDPMHGSVAEEVIANAISSATRDPRFVEVQPGELHLLEYSVDVLTSPEPVENLAELNPREFGVIVECLGRRGLLLPDLEGVDTIDDQIDICRGKAGIAPWEQAQLYKFRVRRYL